ncbi:MAG: polymer-forming cytoskeletal protein [Prevotellaceae bacterium]|jgi:cytoskeletal protein CcmA (bactofilin family)|nr:polymer-forming cytoskeletal protein [Prevotellaceae bacterium]
MGKNTVEETPVSGNVNRICEGTEITGSVKSSTDFRIDGRIEGNVQCGGRIIIGEKGYVKGEIVSKNMEISGQIIGTVSVDELLSLKSSAVVEGEITTRKLYIEVGAVFNGSCHMVKKGAEKPAQK